MWLHVYDVKIITTANNNVGRSIIGLLTGIINFY